MKIYKNIDKFQAKDPVVTIGTFDGVHKGHDKIIGRLKEIAEKTGGETVVLTFWPHPRIVLRPERNDLKLLNTPEEKSNLLERKGIDHLIIYPFTKDFSKMSSYDFTKNVLFDHIGVRHLVFGYDHQFGHNKEGKFDNLKNFSEEMGFKIEKIEAFSYRNKNISSTEIRNALLEGDIERSNDYLGYDYCMNGIVISGGKLGRQIGFPTANISVPEKYKLIPANGVYAIKAITDGKEFKGMLNIGVRPTVDNKNRDMSIEAHIFDFNENIYNKNITIIFKQKIREEKKFDNIGLLKEQLEKDKQKALKILE